MVDYYLAKRMAGKNPEIICIYHAGEGSDAVEICSSASERFRSMSCKAIFRQMGDMAKMATMLEITLEQTK